MSVYVNLKCSGCGKSLTGGYTRDYRGVGSPLLECPKCGTVRTHGGRVTEWELMPPFKRFWLFFSLGWSTLFYFGAGSAIVGMVLLAKDVITTLPMFIGFVVLSLFVGFLRLYLYFRRTISDSKKRMLDKGYREKLRKRGFIR